MSLLPERGFCQNQNWVYYRPPANRYLAGAGIDSRGFWWGCKHLFIILNFSQLAPGWKRLLLCFTTCSQMETLFSHNLHPESGQKVFLISPNLHLDRNITRYSRPVCSGGLTGRRVGLLVFLHLYIRRIYNWSETSSLPSLGDSKCRGVTRYSKCRVICVSWVWRWLNRQSTILE